jgi:hypothetical protein
MIWLTIAILIIAVGIQNRMISQLEEDNEWLLWQMVVIEERIMRVEEEKDGSDKAK